MKKVALYGGLLALVGVGSAFAAGQFPGYPLATSSPQTGFAVTYPLTGNETIPADTNLTQTLPNGTVTGSIIPQTEIIQTSQLKAYVLTSPTTTGSATIPAITGPTVVTGALSSTTTVKPGLLTVATLPTCTSALQGAIAAVSDGAAWTAAASAGVPGAAVATGAVTRSVVCTNTAGATTYAWAFM